MLGWVAPLEHDGFAEPRDRDFLRPVGCEDLGEALGDFWPAREPVWDALAVAVLPSARPGVVLVEGKSYPEELRSGGTKAGEISREKILRAVETTQRAIGIEHDKETWLGPLYQTANRLAHLYWLREHEVEAWFAHLLFENDHTHGRPTTREAFKAALIQANRELGLEGAAMDRVGHAFLPALAPAELERQPRPV